MQDIQEKKKIVPLSDIRIVETPAGSLGIRAGSWQPQSRLEVAAYEAHSSLAKAFGNLRAERDLTIAVGETNSGKLIFAANEDSPQMRELLQSLARKYQGHTIYRNEVRAFARLLNIQDLFSIRQFHHAEAQIAFLEEVYKEHCLKLRSMAATRLICDKCFQQFLLARGIEPVTLLKEIAEENLKEFRRLLRQPATCGPAREARLQARQKSREKRWERARPGALPPGLVPRGGGFVKAVSWFLVGLEVLKLGWEIYEGVLAIGQAEKATAEREAYRRKLAEYAKQLEEGGLVRVSAPTHSPKSAPLSDSLLFPQFPRSHPCLTYRSKLEYSQ